jgi:hypothetical protein
MLSNMAKKKFPKPKLPSKEQLMAEFFYEYGRNDCLTKWSEEILDEETLVKTRAAVALKQWKETGGRKRDNDISIAYKLWLEAGKPAEGIRMRISGFVHIFKPDGQYDELASFKANFKHE